jgi:hypothetical protein
MSEQERQLRELEEEIPLLAGPAFAAAYQNALKSGMVFVQAIGNDLYESSSRRKQEVYQIGRTCCHLSC